MSRGVRCVQELERVFMLLPDFVNADLAFGCHASQLASSGFVFANESAALVTAAWAV